VEKSLIKEGEEDPSEACTRVVVLFCWTNLVASPVPICKIHHIPFNHH